MKNEKKRVAVLANLKQNAPELKTESPDIWDDLDSMSTINSLIESLTHNGYEADFFEAQISPPYRVIDKLEKYEPDICFNIAEGHSGDGREAQIPAMLEMLQLPYTGSRVMTLALALDKPMTKRVLSYHELPTPEFQVFESSDEEINEDLLNGAELKFPLFIKPSREGTGMGVSAQSIINDFKDLRNGLKDMLSRYRQPVLCERFIEGREVTVGLVGNLKTTAARRLSDRTAPNVLPEELTFFPPLELNIEKYDESEAGLYTNRVKVELVDDWHYTCPADIDAERRRELFEYSAAVFRVLGCRDVSRVDFRLDRSDNDKPYILEINPLPGLNPTYSDLPIEAYAHGWTYDMLIDRVISAAVERWHMGGKN